MEEMYSVWKIKGKDKQKVCDGTLEECLEARIIYANADREWIYVIRVMGKEV